MNLSNPDPGLEYRRREEHLKMSEISIWLDGYDDIFSDFDPRPYSERVLSDDFLKEAQKVSDEKFPATHELNLLVPRAGRETKTEKIIRKRLKLYFRARLDLARKDLLRMRLKGLMLVGIAIVILTVATLVSLIEEKNLAAHMFLVLLEPAGWFTIWNGFDELFFAPAKKKPTLEFYRKMARCNIVFVSY
ncbi:MAG: hypothetical protein EPN93_14485 [Spirochaetes bacterium]|nr:MAG: hypothetical protein EPN93_14485 [Spirochaetota bacterium]